MSQSLPVFAYHPNPVATGVIKVSDRACACCGKSRGYIYVGPVYAIEELDDRFCPWCIADGTAAAKFDATFADDHPLIKAGLSTSIVDEVSRRTPGYVSWQQECWLSHSNDACEFHGDAPANEVANASPETRAGWQREYSLDARTWDEITERYEPGGDPAFYKFVCRNCRLVLLGWDCT